MQRAVYYSLKVNKIKVINNACRMNNDIDKKVVNNIIVWNSACAVYTQ